MPHSGLFSSACGLNRARFPGKSAIARMGSGPGSRQTADLPLTSRGVWVGRPAELSGVSWDLRLSEIVCNRHNLVCEPGALEALKDPPSPNPPGQLDQTRLEIPMPGTTHSTPHTAEDSHSGPTTAAREHLIRVIHGTAIHVQPGYEDYLSLSDAAALADALIASCDRTVPEP